MELAPIPLRRSCGGSRQCSRSPPFQERHSAASASRRPRRRRRGPLRVPPHGCCTTRRCRPGPVGAWTRLPRDSTANASGSSRTASFLPTWLRATVGSPRLHSGPGHQCSRTATCRSATCSSTVTRSPAWSIGPRRPRRCPVRPRYLDALDMRSTLATSLPTALDADLDVIRAWWSWRSLVAARRPSSNGVRPVLTRSRVRRAEIDVTHGPPGPTPVSPPVGTGPHRFDALARALTGRSVSGASVVSVGWGETVDRGQRS